MSSRVLAASLLPHLLLLTLPLPPPLLIGDLLRIGGLRIGRIATGLAGLLCICLPTRTTRSNRGGIFACCVIGTERCVNCNG